MNNEHPELTAALNHAVSIPPPERELKTPAPLRTKARNWHRRKNGVPEAAPLYTRAEPFNRARKGTGNVTRRVSMPLSAWELLEELMDRGREKRTRGEVITEALKLEDHITSPSPD